MWIWHALSQWPSQAFSKLDTKLVCGCLPRSPAGRRSGRFDVAFYWNETLFTETLFNFIHGSERRHESPRDRHSPRHREGGERTRPSSSLGRSSSAEQVDSMDLPESRSSTISWSPLRRSSSSESAPRDGSPVDFSAVLDTAENVKDKSLSDEEDEEGSHRKVSSAQYQLFRQAVTSSKGSYKLNPAKSRRAARASLLDLGEGEVTDKVSWLDQPSLVDTMTSTARIAQGLKEDEEVEKTTLSENHNSGSSSFKHLTVKQMFPREPYRLKVHRDAQYLPKPPAEDGFSDKPPSSYQISHRMSKDTEELARRAAIYASLADSMVASVIEELSPQDQRSKLLREKLAITQEAQVSAISAGFAAASNLQLLWPDALLKNFGFQPQVLSMVRTAPFKGPHVVGPEPKVLQNRVQTILQADRMVGSSVTFVQKPKENKTSTKATSSTKKSQPRSSVFERLGSPAATTVQRTVSQQQPFHAGADRGARHRPYPA